MIAFVVLLIASAVVLLIGSADVANSIALYGFVSLVIGVALQIASYAKYGEADATAAARTRSPTTGVASPSTRLPSRTKIAAVAAFGLLLLAGAVVEYPTLFHMGGVSPEVNSSTSSSRSGCVGPRNDGTVFIATNATVSITICGGSFSVNAGSGGGLSYAYHAGLVNFTAPDSTDGSRFEFWYVILGSNPPQRVNSVTLTLDLPAGMTSQDSLIELFYAAPPAQAQPTAATSTTSGTITSTLTVTSTTASVLTVTTTVTTTLGCRGDDGAVFVVINVDATVPIDICGEQALVSGGVGGGFTFGYHAGVVTFIAPATVDGKSFQFWYVVLPSQQEKVASSELTIVLPAGATSSNSVIEAFYG